MFFGSNLKILVNEEDIMQKKESLHGKLEFLDYRRQQEKRHFSKNAHIGGVIKSLLTVEINSTELCNRKCIFCPRFDESIYPNRNLHMSVFGAEIVAKRLAEVNYTGKISFSGFGENFLNPNFSQIIAVFREHLSGVLIECNTNGDHLTVEVIDEVFSKGLDHLYINLYDGVEQIESFEKIVGKKYLPNVKYRMHWDEKDHGLILNNRSGKITWTNIDEGEVEALRGKACHYPFYKMFVDWNGDVLFCSNDWGKERVIGNPIQDRLEDVWFSKAMTKIRKRLAKGDRSLSPCSKCNVGGRLFGEESFRILNEYYENSDNG